jgi:tetratricopeptide (TPR) repeat protein
VNDTKGPSQYSELESSAIKVLNRPPEDALGEVRMRERPQGEIAYLAGEIYQAAGKPLEAATSLATALEADPGSPLAQAAYLFLTGRGDARVDAIREITLAWPELERPRFYLGVALGSVYRYGEASEFLGRAAQAAPEDAQCWFHLAHCLRRQGDRQGARDASRRVLRLAASFPWKRAACQQLFQAGAFSEAFAASLKIRREFGGLRAALLPWTLPVQVNALLADSVVAATWLLVLVLLTNHEWAIGALVVASILTVWRVLAIYSSGSMRLSAERRRLRRWRRNLPDSAAV